MVTDSDGEATCYPLDAASVVASYDITVNISATAAAAAAIVDDDITASLLPLLPKLSDGDSLSRQFQPG